MLSIKNYLVLESGKMSKDSGSICPVLGLYSISGYTAGCQIQLVSKDFSFDLYTGTKLGNLIVLLLYILSQSLCC